MSTPDPERLISKETHLDLVVDGEGALLDLRRNWRLAVLFLSGLIGYCVISAGFFDVLEVDGPFFDPVEKCQNCLATGVIARYFDSLYLTWINVTTVGFGDIAPHTWATKVLACLNSLIGLVVMGWVVAIVTSSLAPPYGNGTMTSGETGPSNARGQPRRGLPKLTAKAWAWAKASRSTVGPSDRVKLTATADERIADLQEEVASARVHCLHLEQQLQRERDLVGAFLQGAKGYVHPIPWSTKRADGMSDEEWDDGALRRWLSWIQYRLGPGTDVHAIDFGGQRHVVVVIDRPHRPEGSR